MRLGRPRTLLGLILCGLALVALPLLVAIGHAALKLGQLNAESEAVVADSSTATREIQRLQSLLADMERNARQFLVLQEADLLGLYDGDQAALEQSLSALAELPGPPELAARLDQLRHVSRHVQYTLRAGPGDTTVEQVVVDFRLMNAASREVSQAMRTLINENLAALQEHTRAAQQTLAWQAAALVPGIAVLLWLFVVLVGKPMRLVDRAIRELGQGHFSQPIEVTGPRDIETLGRQLEWLRHRLKESTDEKNKFLRHMSHELKTPLANIREGTELLLDGSVGPLGHQQHEVASILRDNGIKLQKLIENLLNFSAWQTQTASLEISEVELKPLVFGVLSQHRLAIATKKIRLQINASALRIRADEGKLRLVLDNLLSNAVKFTPEGGTIAITARMLGQELLLDVIDSGPGVAPEDGDRIFEAFYQGRRLQGGAVGGTGIGLSVVSECVLAHGGTVVLIDDDRPGAHFQVRLPLRRAEDKPALVVNA
jgi:two-component system, NtrC family, sensor histidine kinase GlrK